MTEQHMDSLRWISASAVSVASGSIGWLNGQDVLTVLGGIVALLTIVERYYAIKIKRRNDKRDQIEFDRLVKGGK